MESPRTHRTTNETNLNCLESRSHARQAQMDGGSSREHAPDVLHEQEHVQRVGRRGLELGHEVLVERLRFALLGSPRQPISDPRACARAITSCPHGRARRPTAPDDRLGASPSTLAQSLGCVDQRHAGHVGARRITRVETRSTTQPPVLPSGCSAHRLGGARLRCDASSQSREGGQAPRGVRR